ncbi:MAG: prolipoprotein diacylglyceryl transferase [Candidatus Marinimicrobia bacterium]|nr:prolipoprotein diacylglyceryl transferase [Candidatus Neomarinimicrobiota bacterium]
MHPTLFKFENLPIIGDLTIRTYGFMMAVAFLTCYFILQWEVKRRKQDPIIAADIVFWAAIGGIVGGRLFYLFEHFSRTLQDPLGMIFSGSGLVFHGGLIGGTIAVILFLLKKRKPLGMYADIIAPLLLIGHGIGRIGCFFAGCCHGVCTNSFLGVTFPRGSNAFHHQIQEGLIEYSANHPMPVHPTQLYEMGFNFIMAFILIKYIRPKLKYRWSTFALYFIITGTERFLIEFIRINPEGFLGLTNYQFSSLFLIITGAIIFKWFAKQPKTELDKGK